jgi:hypothetical protein
MLGHDRMRKIQEIESQLRMFLLDMIMKVGLK